MRKLALFASGFAAAVFAACCAVPLDWLVWLGLGCALGAAALRRTGGRWGKRFMLLLAGLAAGSLWFRGWTAVRLSPVERLADTTGPIRAVVTEYPAASDYGERVEVTIDGIPALLYTRGDGGELEPGDEVRVTAALSRADTRREEKTALYTSRGVFLLAYAGGEIEKVSRPERTPVWTLPSRWARALKERIPEVFPADAAGLTASVLLGDKSGLTAWDSASLSRSGLAHVTAVSGLHIGILTQLLMLVCRRRRLAAGAAIPALVLFTLVTGASPGTVRAAVMQIILLLAPLLEREADSPTSLSFALLVLLMWNPYAAASVGLQLSFAAVAGILLASRPVMERLESLWSWDGEERRSPLAKVWHFLCGTVSATLGALLFTAPLSAYYFGSVSLVGIVSNLLALWAVSVVFLSGLFAVLAGAAVPALGALAALPGTVCARWVLWLSRGLGALPFAAVSMEFPAGRIWLAAVYLLLGAAALPWKRRPRLIPVLCAMALLLGAAFRCNRVLADRALSVSALDVGQGASTAIISRGRTVLVDCGGNGGNAGDTAADYFQAMGLNRLDLLVLTHFDADHFNGVEELFRRMDVAAVAIPATDDPYGRAAELYAWAESDGAAVTEVSALTGAALGEGELTLYPPLGRGTTNEEGLSVLFSVGDYDVLITGDADSAIEGMLTKYFHVPDIELLLVGHHGSKRSTGGAFLAEVKPETAVISVGSGNPYGHPAPEVLERLEAAGAEVFRTDLQGRVTVILGEE